MHHRSTSAVHTQILMTYGGDAGDAEELSLLAVVPSGSGECLEFQLDVSCGETGEKLKRKIEKLSGISADDMELFVKNQGEGATQKWVKEDETLKKQGIEDSAIITVGVHGMAGQAPLVAQDDDEIPNDAVSKSIHEKGASSYYHAHSRKPELSEEQRIVSGGAPQKLSESDTCLPEPVSQLKQLKIDDPEDSQRLERPICNYAWGDEKDVVKVYISADAEPEAVKAAGDGKNGQLDVRWQSRSLKLRVHGEKFDYVLELERVYYEIIPEECKFRVSQNKRITLSLKKKENFTWLKLLKPEA